MAGANPIPPWHYFIAEIGRGLVSWFLHSGDHAPPRLKPFLNGDGQHNAGEGMDESTPTTSREELSSTETGLLLTRIFETGRALRGESPTRLHSLAAISETEGEPHAA